MKKVYTSALLAAFASTIIPLYATPRNRAEARLCAEAFLMQQTDGTTLPHAAALRTGTSADDEAFEPYYIFNSEDRSRFVLVSGSDKTSPIIGYGEGDFDAGQMPDNLRNWLKYVSEAISYMEEHPGRCSLESSSQQSTAAVAPLMGKIEWSQNYPYNLRCPIVNGDNCPCGCVATAAAQCIYHYRYPSQGVGQHTNAKHPNLSINFANSTYDYDMMFDSFHTQYIEGVGWADNPSDSQMAEVAKLSYHCGIMCDMIYSAESSSSTLVSLRRGMIEHMQYDPYAQIVMRRTRTYDEWNELLQNELQHQRPIILSGHSSETNSGHSFILDGIDDHGLYHVNWGWSGAFNGYFDVTIMRPEDDNVAFNPDGYCSEQMALIQLAPKGKVADAQYLCPLTAPDGKFSFSATTAKLGDEVLFSLSNFYNYSSQPFHGKTGLIFMRNGQKVAFVPNTAKSLDLDTYYGFTSASFQVKLPNSLPNGDYQVYPAAQNESAPFNGQNAIIYTKADRPNYVNCRIDGDKVIFTNPSYETKLTVEDWSFEHQNLKTAVAQKITCIATNDNPINTIVGKFLLEVTSPEQKSVAYLCPDIITLRPGESKTLSFHIFFDKPGQWTSQLYLFNQNIDYDVRTESRLVDGTRKTFNVTADVTTEAVFTLTAAPKLVSNPQYGDSLFINQEASFSLSIRNQGNAYSGNMQIQLYKTSTSTSILATITQPMEIPVQSEATYTLNGILEKVDANFSTALSGTTYYAKAAFDYAGTYKLFSTPAGINNRVTVKCYNGSPATNLNLTVSEDSSTPIIYNLQGQRGNIHQGDIFIKQGKKMMKK